MRNKKLLRSLLILLAGTAALAGTVRGKETRVAAYEEGKKTQQEEEDRIYGIGSVSKIYVTTAVMQLVEQGLVELDAPVTKYLPEFSMADERYQKITVRMLANHTSGIYGTTAKSLFLYDDNKAVATETVIENLKTQRLKADSGAYACYCNDGFELLEAIVERVSGMSYTDYVEKNIAERLGATQIYSAVNVLGNEALAKTFHNNTYRLENEFIMGLGTGGMYSTARDTCEFGSTFFNGDNRLLSEESKAAMASLWSRDTVTDFDKDLMDQCGLGWDLVGIKRYEEAGVKALSKGGDTSRFHAELLVFPEEEISVCVTTSGGASEFGLAMASALADIVLSERGIEVKEEKAPEVTLERVVPERYCQYEGLYSLEGMPGFISFPDQKYMKIVLPGGGTSVSYYRYSDKGFVKVTGDIENGTDRIDSDFNCLDFSEVNGTVYVTQQRIEENNGLIGIFSQGYIGEKLEKNPVPESDLKAWQERSGIKYEIISEKYSSSYYEGAFFEIRLLEDTGYLYYRSLMENQRLLKILDKDHVCDCTSIPNSTNRDTVTVFVDEEGVFHDSRGISGKPVTDNPAFDSSVKTVALSTENAAWYTIDPEMAGKIVSFTRPENSAVYVYDKYGDMIYNTHMIDYGTRIHLPKSGMIVFLGEDGGRVEIHESKGQ